MSLETVLRELSAPARDPLLKEFRRHSDVYKVRLVCKAFRDFIDGALQVFRLALSPTHQELLNVGQPPPDLPRCRELKIRIRDLPKWKSTTYAAVLRMCVRSFPSQLRDRITTLRVEYIEKKVPGPHIALAGALSCLPALTHVHLSRIPRARDEPLQLELLYDTLTALPCLESLSVPDLGDVRHLVRSGHNRSLKRLASRGTKGLSPDVCKNLASFEQLRHLRIGGFTDVPGALVAQLLDNLPPRLEELFLRRCSLTLSSGFITHVRFDESYDADLNEMLRSLLHCRAMPPRLARLAFVDLPVAADLPSDSPLAEILRRSDEVKVDCMVLEPGATGAESKAVMSSTLERFLAAGHPLKYTGPIQKARQEGNTSDGGCGVLDDALTPLSGPHVAALAPNPGALDEWLRDLWQQTTHRFTGAFMWMVGTFVALLEQRAVLVCFFGLEVLAGFAKVVIAAAAKMRAAGSQAPAVQVTQVPIRRGESRHQDHVSGVCGYIFNQLVQRLWAEVCGSTSTAAAVSPAMATTPATSAPEAEAAATAAAAASLTRGV